MTGSDSYLRLECCRSHQGCIEVFGGGTGGILRVELHLRQAVALEIWKRLTALLVSATSATSPGGRPSGDGLVAVTAARHRTGNGP